MKIASIFAATAIAAAMSTSAVAATDLGVLSPSASFSRTVMGGFSDIWNFDLGTASIVAASITNVEVTFGSFVAGGISDFAATLNGVSLQINSLSSISGPVTVATQVLTGSTTLPAGQYQLVVTGSGVTGGSASYGGNIVAVAAPVPEPESYAMFLAGLGIMGAIAARRNKAKKG